VRWLKREERRRKKLKVRQISEKAANLGEPCGIYVVAICLIAGSPEWLLGNFRVKNNVEKDLD
jgi:hypothetical protein